MYSKTFIEIGCDIQRMAINAAQAEKQIEKTCDICCCHGINMECRTCPIWACHKMVMEQKFGKKVQD